MTPEAGIAIRPLRAADHAATRRVVDDAFRPEDVVTFLDALRADPCLLGEWLAETTQGAPVGCIGFSRVWIDAEHGRCDAVMLTPLAVRPDRQRQGIGGALVRHGLAALEAQGERIFLVLGHPAYYPRFGFDAARASGLLSPWPNEPAFMARCDRALAGRLALPSVIATAH